MIPEEPPLARSNKDISIVDFHNLEQPETTEFRRILHHVNDFAEGGEKPAILITSAMLSEGKSVISAYLSMTAARVKNRKTLLIDFDLRRPMIHALFSAPLEKGVSDIMTQGASSRNVIKSTSIEALDILTAGKVVPNPSDLVSGPSVHRIIEESKFYYDIILVDSPPLIPVMDPILLLEELDGAILVIKAGSTQREVAKRASGLLSSHKDKVIGVIVNNIDQTLPYYYNYSYYGYKHKPSKD
jgi:capsular exopolysaccharide synthesis family protein